MGNGGIQIGNALVDGKELFERVDEVDNQPNHRCHGEEKGEGEGIPWINPRKHPKGRRKVNPREKGDVESIPARRTTQSLFQRKGMTQSLSPRTLRIPNPYRRHQWTEMRAYQRVSQHLLTLADFS